MKTLRNWYTAFDRLMMNGSREGELHTDFQAENKNEHIRT